MIRACDHLFTGGILFLIVFTPFAFGAVHPWAYSTMEVVIFALVIVWMLKLALLARKQGAGSIEQGSDRLTPHASRLTPMVLPLALFITLCALQLVPLPPSFLQIISPQTFETYRQILPGWPERMPYGEVEAFVGAEELMVKDSAANAADVSGEALGVRRNATNATNAERNNATNATDATG